MIRRAFTLIELLTVIAITAVLLTIITIPLVQSFNITRAAQGFADAQDRARGLVDRVVREIGNGAGIRDNSGARGSVLIFIPTDPNQTAANNTYRTVLLENARIDILVPAQGEPTVAPGGGLIDPDTGRVDPTLRTPKGDVNLPVASGFRLVRYFVGLREPLAGTEADPQFGRYNNPYDGLLMRRSGQPDNLYVLYRAEVNLREYDPVSNSWQLNRELFDVDANGVTTPAELEQALDDPAFFTLNETALPARQAKARRIRAWLARSRVTTEFSRYDMIQPIFDRRTFRAQFDPVTGLPRVISLIQFTPTRVDSQPLQGMAAVRAGEESSNALKIGPDVYTASFGNWSTATLRMRPSSFLNASNVPELPWVSFEPWNGVRPFTETQRRAGADMGAGRPDSEVTLFDVDPATNARVATFDASAYLRAKTGALTAGDTPTAQFAQFAQFPATFAIQVAALGQATNLLNSDRIRQDFIPFFLDSQSGKVIASFDVTEFGEDPAGLALGEDNRPVAGTGPPLLPGADPAASGTGSLTRWTSHAPSSPTATINQRFNILWQDWGILAPGLDRQRFVRRFVDLRVLRQQDDSWGPLAPWDGFRFDRARIVPGSDIVIGPDQNAGPNYGLPVRYTRVSTPDNVGANQYYINYVNQPEPYDAASGQSGWLALVTEGAIANNGVPTSAQLLDPRLYQANNFFSEILQARYRAGYIEFNSRPSEPLPAGGISIRYRVQFTEPNDVLEVDLDTRELINVSIAIRNFPQTTNPNVQTVTVKGQARVRNIQR